MTTPSPTRHRDVVRREVTVRGVVQGVGFRPFVARLAAELGLAGWCGNEATRVFVQVEGVTEVVAEFCRRIVIDAPPLAAVMDLHVVDLDPTGEAGFVIAPSRVGEGADGPRTLVPPDVATCSDCLTEFADPTDRRFRHPFITCTNCGPRFTIIEALPYDRPATTMADFEMCAACASEYADPTNRRHHAQPVSCHDCGPQLWAERPDGTRAGGAEDALEAVGAVLADGGIVAVKGLGGFHLACDATNPGAVARLRERKHRPDKPFAVMVTDELVAASIGDVTRAHLDALQQPSRPIVLVPDLGSDRLAAAVNPGLGDLGIFLPYTGLHHLLTARFGLLVMTSGNLADEPLCFDDDDARSRLGRIADLFLMHDRRIAVPCEDSVVTIVDGAELPLRRSRGYAPLPVLLDADGPGVLAVGAEVKNTFTLTRGDLAFCSAHLGDMGSLESRQAFEVSVRQFTALHAVEPALLVADEHPGYLTRQWAERHSEDTGVPLELVQHHHAHFASLLAEHRLLGTPALGVTFDGTGYSCDRTVWGGELLHSTGDIARVDRIGHLEQFALPGGDAAIREPWRVAMALLDLAGIEDPWGLALTTEVPEASRAVVVAQLGSGTAMTSSAGRLFDGVAALLGVRCRVGYEAQAAVELEHLARQSRRSVRLRVPVTDGVLEIGPLIAELVRALRDGADVDALARGFHEALAEATALLVVRRAGELGTEVVGLTGGVMQNRFLVARLTAVLRRVGLRVLTHRVVPPNDGGLSLGQAVVARARAEGGV